MYIIGVQFRGPAMNYYACIRGLGFGGFGLRVERLKMQKARIGLRIQEFRT